LRSSLPVFTPAKRGFACWALSAGRWAGLLALRLSAAALAAAGPLLALGIRPWIISGRLALPGLLSWLRLPRLRGLCLPRLALGGLPRLVGRRRLAWARLGLLRGLLATLRWLCLSRLGGLRLSRLRGLRLTGLVGLRLPSLTGL